MHNPVSHGGKFIEALQNPMVAVEQRLDHYLEGHLVVGNFGVPDDGIHAGLRMLDTGSLYAYSLHKSLGEHRFVGHVKKLILEG